MTQSTGRTETCRRCGTALSHKSLRGLCSRCLAVFSLPEFLSTPGETVLPRGAPPAAIATRLSRFGDYELLEPIAHGGMGMVYRARQVSLNRVVAVKMLLFGEFADASRFRRFQAEAEAVARLQHPNIVAIHEIGSQDGQPYFSMDYVAGSNLAELVHDRPLPVRSAAVYTAKIARAVQHAHDRGILHRDLKPANVLVDEADEPRITDFGLAKQISVDSQLTVTGQVIGSPQFLAPEQATAGRREVGPASDVYSLGALLYFMLTARPPFVADSLEATLVQVLDQDPIPPRVLKPTVPRDLETICLKCLEKDPAQRYARGIELAEDLQRFLEDKPIRARAIGFAGRTWRWCKRRPALAAMGAVSAVLALALVWGAASATARIVRERDAAQLENYYSSIALAETHVRNGNLSRALELLLDCPARYRHWEWGYLARLCHPEVRSLQVEVDSSHTSKDAIQRGVVRAGMRAMAVDPTGVWVAVLDQYGAIRVYDSANSRQRFPFGGDSAQGAALASSPDGKLLAVRWLHGGVSVIEVAHSRAVWEHAADPNEVTALAFDQGGQMLALHYRDGLVRIVDAATGSLVRSLRTSVKEVFRLSFTLDNANLIVSERGRVEIHGIKSTAFVKEISLTASQDASLFPDPEGNRFVSITPNGDVRLWEDEKTSRFLVRLKGTQPMNLHSLFFSGDGKRFCTGGEGGTARVWDAENAEELFSIPYRVYLAAFSPDGSRLITAGGDNWIRVWEVPSGKDIGDFAGHNYVLQSLAFLNDGKTVVSADRGGWVEIWRSDPGRELLSDKSCVWGTSVSPDGDMILAAPWNNEFAIWDSNTGKVRLRVHTPLHLVCYSKFSPDGRRVVTAGDKTARVWDVSTGRQVAVFDKHGRRVAGVDWSSDGKAIATVGWDGAARVWDPTTGYELQRFQHGCNMLFWVAFHPDGDRLATASEEGVKLWQRSSGKLLHHVPLGPAGVDRVVFTPDERRILASDADFHIYLLDVDGLKRVTEWTTHGDLGTASFTKDGQRCVIPTAREMGLGRAQAAAELRDGLTGRLILTLRGHTEPMTTAQFTPDDDKIITSSFDCTTRQWETFPWRESEYQGLPGRSLRQKLRAFADHYWAERISAQTASTDEDPIPSQEVVAAPARSAWPIREGKATSMQLNLDAFYNGVLWSAFYPFFIPGQVENDLSEFPAGSVTLGGVRFDARGVITLRRRDPNGGVFQLNWDRYPVRVTDIPVGAEVHRLHVLHGATGREASGTRVGWLNCRYADGRQERLEIRYGRDVFDWWEDPPAGSKSSSAHVVWRGSNPYASAQGASVRLFVRTWELSHPDVELQSLDFESALTTSAPFLVAITVE